ncbi:hypothetical protein LguiB_017453 [Lonicera macranthoides]
MGNYLFNRTIPGHASFIKGFCEEIPQINIWGETDILIELLTCQGLIGQILVQNTTDANCFDEKVANYIETVKEYLPLYLRSYSIGPEAGFNHEIGGFQLIRFSEEPCLDVEGLCSAELEPIEGRQNPTALKVNRFPVRILLSDSYKIGEWPVLRLLLAGAVAVKPLARNRLQTEEEGKKGDRKQGGPDILFRLEALDLIDFPWRPLTASQLHQCPYGLSWSEILRPPPPPSSPSGPDSDSPAEDPSDNFNIDDNRNPDISDIDWLQGLTDNFFDEIKTLPMEDTSGRAMTA